MSSLNSAENAGQGPRNEVVQLCEGKFHITATSLGQVENAEVWKLKYENQSMEKSAYQCLEYTQCSCKKSTNLIAMFWLQGALVSR